MSEELDEPQYNSLLQAISQHIVDAQTQAAASLNQTVIRRNYAIGKEIIERRAQQGWGNSVVKSLAADLQESGLSGMGYASLQDMAKFASLYDEKEIVHPRVDNLPWSFHQRIMRLANNETRFWYMEQTSSNRWTRTQLETSIKEDLHTKRGKGLSNFAATLPHQQAEQAQQLMQSRYDFTALGLTSGSEWEIENGLVARIGQMIQTLGHGFAFVKQQYSFSEGDQDFRIDLLFYHTKLHCYVVIELKDDVFKPSFSGQLNFYVSSIDDIEKTDADQPTIGILLCRDYNPVIVERTLRGNNAPIHVSGYTIKQQILDSLPDELRHGLPDSV